jgi:hypothetical protein
MSVYVYSVFVLSCVGRGLAKGRSPVEEVLPTVYKIKSFIFKSEWKKATGLNTSRRKKTKKLM